MDQVKKFVSGFFESLGTKVQWEVGSGKSEVLRVENVPGKFEEYFGRVGPYEFVFDDASSEMFAGKGSDILEKILGFLKRGGKMSILRIDFADVDSEEVLGRLNLKNCEVESVGRRFKNNFFTRFSFVVNFNYLNESERVVEEVFVYDGEVVSGDLDGYTTLDCRESIVDGRGFSVDKERVKADYEVALKGLGERLVEMRERISGDLRVKMDEEVERIQDYYEVQLREFGGDLEGRLEKIRDLELEIRARSVRQDEQDGENECGLEDVEVLKRRLEKLRQGVVKVGDDDAVERVRREREATIDDARQRFSLGVDRKLVNTTVVYYPVFVFKVCLREGNSKRLIEVCYDPLTWELDGLRCESCGKVLDRVNLCENGHLVCDGCVGVCGECGGKFCAKCLERSCASCGRKLCKNCVRVCRGCGRVVCSTHLRRDCVSGEERCVFCLRACLRCNGLAEDRFFGEARDGSKVCLKCLGVERREAVLGSGFS